MTTLEFAAICAACSFVTMMLVELVVRWSKRDTPLPESERRYLQAKHQAEIQSLWRVLHAKDTHAHQIEREASRHLAFIGVLRDNARSIPGKEGQELSLKCVKYLAETHRELPHVRHRTDP